MSSRRLALLMMAGFASGGQIAVAQMNPSSGAYANPYANPYMNPFVNPYLSQAQVQANPALYFLAAQQASGGLGSGQLSGTRPGRPPATPAPAQPASRRVTDVPGASASTFFNRSLPPSRGTGRYYNRAGRYYPSNSH